MKIFELLIDELDDITGVDAVALVEQPAIESNFFAFKNENLEDVIEFNLLKLAVKEHFESGSYETIEDGGKPLYDTIEEAEKVAKELGCEGHHEHEIEGKIWYMPCKEHSDLTDDLLENFTKVDTKDYAFSVVGDQQMVVGPLMIPNKLILRVDENNEPYHVYFSEKTIKEIAEKVMREKYIDSLNIEHNSEDKVDGYMVSTWIIEDEMKDKQQVYGFNLPVGTWMGQYKIQDMSVWEKVKNGDIKGFSIEGFFGDRYVQAKKQK